VSDRHLPGSLLIAILAASGTEAAELPSLLREFLDKQPAYRLLEAADTLDGVARPAFAVGDANGDGLLDVAAVVVKRRSGKPMISVVCINGSRNGRHPTFWLERDVETPTYSIVIKQKPRLILPLHCTECESDPWFAWNGSEYEANLRFPGDVLYLTFGAGSIESVPVSATPGGPPVFNATAGTRALVKGIGKRVAGTRWYEVEVGPRRVHGFAQEHSLKAPID
jgi:hypothetical protein